MWIVLVLAAVILAITDAVGKFSAPLSIGLAISVLGLFILAFVARRRANDEEPTPSQRRRNSLLDS